MNKCGDCIYFGWYCLTVKQWVGYCAFFHINVDERDEDVCNTFEPIEEEDNA